MPLCSKLKKRYKIYMSVMNWRSPDKTPCIATGCLSYSISFFVILKLVIDCEFYQNLNVAFFYLFSFISEIPGEVLRVKMVSLHVRITRYFTRANNRVIFRSEKMTIAMATCSL